MKEKLVALAQKHGATGLQPVYHCGKFYYFSGAAYFDANEDGIRSYLKLQPAKSPKTPATAH